MFNTLLFSIVINRSFSIFLVFCLFNILVRHSIPLHLINESKGSVSHFVYTCFTKSLPVFSQCCKGPQSSDVPTTGNQFNSLLSRATKVVQWYFLFWRFRKLPRYWKNCIYWILGRSCMTTKLAWDYAKGSLDLEDQIISRLRSKFRNYEREPSNLAEIWGIFWNKCIEIICSCNFSLEKLIVNERVD